MRKDPTKTTRGKGAVPAVDDSSLNNFLAQIEGESDRAAVIVGAALLHDLLRSILLAALRPHVPAKSGAPDQLDAGPTSILGTFSGCIDLAHRLGLIGDGNYRDLHNVREMRNICAHKNWDKRIDLSQSPFKDRVEQLDRHLPGTALEMILNGAMLPVAGATTRSSLQLRLFLAVFATDLRRLRDANPRVQVTANLGGWGLDKAPK